MKINYLKSLKYFLLMLASFTILSACRDDDNEGGMAGALPAVDYVAPAVDADGNPSDLTPTSVGFANNTYIIKGSNLASVQHIYFNDYETAFNTNLVTNTHIIVTVNENTPYADVSNKLKIVTGFGTVEYDFTIAPPAPVLKGFHSINAADGETIVIKGNYFVDPVVNVGDLPATVISNTLTEITATLPAGSQGKKVSVTTLSGTATYQSQIGTSIYDDVFYGAVTNSTWSGDVYDIAYDADEANIKQGSKAIKWQAKAYSGFQIDNSPEIPATAKGIRFYAKAKNATDPNSMKLVLNYSWNTTPTITITDTYQYFEIPFASSAGFGLSSTPSTMNLTFNNASGEENDIYLDDIGYYY
ncbi:IPT/TIG domain-containing protein [Kaistella sp. 97-N-M2]|uniref:IPT/TIG domain-containing protein n=1 Tax=Kaistella sp. 97-N-M2 TaxID=2908645 RepID=UPI001F310C8C|nr:IPT/TIG domain-containing protein [Kaistella sp. 97-N-M2]UJF29593.1 IPT/TIG domain-containing protein [Kaistella sp. 97-N-M2]